MLPCGMLVSWEGEDIWTLTHRGVRQGHREKRAICKPRRGASGGAAC